MADERTTSFLDELPEDELAVLLEKLERRRYPAGSVVVAEGDRTNEVYLAEAGHAEVYVANREGVEQRVGGVGPGATIGEMSLFTGQPAVGTVRAASDLDVLVLGAAEFEQLAARHPRIYRNLGSILSDRLAKTNRLAVRDTFGRTGALLQNGGPPELSYALACSVAWHTRASTLFLHVGDRLPDELEGLARGGEGGADVRVTGPIDGTTSLRALVEELFHRYDFILVHSPSGDADVLRTARRFEIVDTSLNGAVPESTLRLVGWAPADAPARPDNQGVLRIPRLTDADLDALRGGLLPQGTAAGRVLGWAARDFAELKVGLALGAGSVRGYAHFGVLRALERSGVSWDYIAGTSVGASIAGLTAFGCTPDQCADILDRCGDVLFRPTLPRKGFMSSRALRRFLHSVTGEARIEDLDMPLAVIAADVLTHQEVVFRQGLLWLAVLASISIPGVYPAVPVDGRLLVDGGILNPVPTSATANMGAQTVIAVRLSSNAPAPETQAVARYTPMKTPSAVSVLLRTIEIMQRRIVSDPADVTTVTITPELEEMTQGRRNFKQGRSYIEIGEAAAEAALPRIKAALPWLA
jgi:NTE family protein